MEPVLVSDCFVFDDSTADLQLRLQQADAVLGSLARKGAIDLAADGAQGFETRKELLEAVADAQRPLVIADMYSDHFASGNIGARVMRAIAEHPVYSARTWRVMWSRHTLDAVTDALASWVHAFAAYDADSTEFLESAICHALSGAAEARVFPAARPIERWSDDLRVVLEELVGEPMPGDERIAPMLKRGASTAEINAELERIDGPHRRSVMKFVSAVQEHRRTATASAAHKLIDQAMGPVAVHQVSDGLPPGECDAALEHRGELHAEQISDEAYLRVTWLTPEEDELLRTFLALYKPRVEGVRAGEEARRYAAIHQIIGSAFDDPLPEWREATERLGLDEDDLAYAIWTLADIRMLR